MLIKTATIIGSTGLIGSHLLELLKNDDDYKTIRLVLRRQLPVDHPKMETRIIDFENATEYQNAIAGSDVVFCAVGTTKQKVKGDEAAYRKVDFDIPVRAAEFCKNNECNTFILVSSAGADSHSNNFYLKLKGEVEEEIKRISLSAVHIMRPSILLGSRDESRLGESIGKTFMQALSFSFIGKLRKYKPIHASQVAFAMAAIAKKDIKGFFIYEYDEVVQVDPAGR